MNRNSKYLLSVAFLLAFFGAILTFALHDEGATRLGVNLQDLGGVLLGAAALLAAGTAIAAVEPTSGSQVSTNNLRAITGLVAVVAGVAAVAALTVVSVTILGGTNKDSVVAITSSAFGIVSAVVTAFLGIKVTAEASAKVTEQGGKTAVAQHEADVKERKIDRVNETIGALEKQGKVTEGAAAAIREASERAEEEARRLDPPLGGGSA
ncbi:MAG TPA: hypothetical protein VFL77_11870 [Solirubrobacterales bacterium]|nr:hypothetical protein [Solirubrobacterales bacterium]